MGVALYQYESAFAGFYKWQDDKGRWHFSDNPNDHPDAKALKLNPLNSMSAVKFSDDEFRIIKKSVKGNNKISLRKGQVVMYSTKSCGFCRRLKEFFRANNVAYTEKDLDASPGYRQEFMNLGGQGVPLTLVGTSSGTHKIAGFNTKKISHLLKLE